MEILLTCHTENCENFNIPLQATVDKLEDLTAYCGVCGIEITDIVEVVPEVPAPKATKGK
jgi:thymidine kinase